MTKAVLITGAAARVGRALSKGLANDGWAVAIHYNRSETAALELAEHINSAGGKAVSIGANLHIPAELDGLVYKAADALGTPLTALINNASTFQPDTAQTFTHAGFDHHVDINLRAPLRLAQCFERQRPDGQNAVIINLIDQRVLKPNPLYFTYSLSKAALNWSTKTLAQSLAPHVRVNAIGPGPTLQNQRQSEADFEAETHSTLLEKGSPPDTILEAVRYLLNAQSVTGQMLAVDGGQHLTWQTQDLLIGLDET